MAKLAGDAYVYTEDGKVYAPGDELPSSLVHLAEGYEKTPEASEAREGTSGGDDGTFDVDGSTVPEIRDYLDSLGVEYAASDRRDVLVAKARSAQSKS